MKHADRNDKTTESKRIQGRNESLMAEVLLCGSLF